MHEGDIIVKRIGFVSMLVFAVITSGGVFAQSASGSRSGTQASVPILGEPSVFQQQLNLLPPVPVAGKKLKFVLGGDTWIAKVDGRDFLAGTITSQDSEDGIIITFSQTHIYMTMPLIGKAGWVGLMGPEIVLKYKSGPQASFSLISFSMGKNDSSARAMVSFINATIEEASNTAILGTASSITPGANSFKVITAQDVGLKDSDFAVTVNRYSTITITGYKGRTKDLVIPSTLYGLTVTHIGENSFRNKYLASVVIPDSVIVIEKNAFSGNRNLKEITIPNSVIIIEMGAFENNNIEKVILGQNVQRIGQNAFKGNRSLKGITIPNSVIIIEMGAFESNNIEKVILGQNVQYIGQNAFRGNGNLGEITIPDSVTRIGENAFANCGITRINWGNGLQIIDKSAFRNNKFTELVLPESLIFAGRQSFSNNPVHTLVIPLSLAQHTNEKGSIPSGFTDAFVFSEESNQSGNQRQMIINTITRITLPADVHPDNMKQFEKELLIYYQTINKVAGTYVKNAPLPVQGSRPYWTKEQ